MTNDKHQTEKPDFAAYLKKIHGYRVEAKTKTSNKKDTGIIFLASKEIDENAKTAQELFFDYFNNTGEKVYPYEFRNAINEMFDLIKAVNNNK